MSNVVESQLITTLPIMYQLIRLGNKLIMLLGLHSYKSYAHVNDFEIFICILRNRKRMYNIHLCFTIPFVINETYLKVL